MLIKKLGVFLLVGCLIFASTPTVSCRSAAPTVYVAGDGSGDFNCDGKDDHVQINQALKFVADNSKSKYTTVHLKGPFTYVIDDTLLIGSNTILEGDSTAVIKLANNAGWKTMKPLIQQMKSDGNDNIVVRGFEVNVNHDGNSKVAKGKGYYNVMYFTHCNNVKVYNMYMHDGHGDGVRVKYGENIQFYNNKISKMGHDGFFASECKNVEAWNNNIVCRTNSGIRIWNSNKVKVHDNVIDSLYYRCTGGPGILIEKSAGTMDNIEIYDNILHDTYGPGIWLFNYDTSSTKEQGKNVRIHNNIFYNTGTNTGITWTGAIVTSGFHDTLIENNVFDSSYHAAIVHMYPDGYSPSYSSKPGYTTIVRNNIIVNTQPRIKSPSGTGYGVANYLTKNHKFVLENNCLFGNSAGNYKGCTSKSDIYVNPLFVDQKKHDYHLQSASGHWNGKKWVKDKASSPCIDAGYASSDYSKEPENNGNRINIGRYGNTVYASLSSTSRVNTVEFPPIEPALETVNETEEALNSTDEFDTDEGNLIYPEPDSLIDVGQPPVIESIPETVVRTGENLSFTVKASDADGDNLTFSASDLPAGASFDEESGFFSWIPEEGQEGFYAVSFEVSDGLLDDFEVAIISVEGLSEEKADETEINEEEANDEENAGEADKEEVNDKEESEEVNNEYENRGQADSREADKEEVNDKEESEEVNNEDGNKGELKNEKENNEGVNNEEANKEEVNKEEIKNQETGNKEGNEEISLNLSGTMYSSYLYGVPSEGFNLNNLSLLQEE